jgi:hypothetical protein
VRRGFARRFRRGLPPDVKRGFARRFAAACRRM